MDRPATYDDLVGRAMGIGAMDGRPFVPYPYQRHLANAGLPELLCVPTGCGKTLAVVMAWLWRRRYHPDVEVRRSTPRRLVYVLPQRVLVEQVTLAAQAWLDRLGLSDSVDVSVLMGGEGRRAGAWRITPQDDAIVVATQDMALSGALNRRFGTSRWSWPIDFGLLNNDCAYVYDEVQLMGPGLPTSRQLDGLRRVLGTAVECTSTWMSATVEDAALRTADRPEVATRAGLTTEDRTGPLARRLEAARTVTRVATGTKADHVGDIAAAVGDAHRPGTRTIAVLNTVRRAMEVAQVLRRGTVPVVLVHSRYRPPDRARHLTAALADVDPAGPGVIVVTTQVLEAGVDISSETLFTEAAPWSSVVQRAGRCNRDGDAAFARLMWSPPPDGAPYDDTEVAASVGLLDSLESMSVTTETMAEMAPTPDAPVIHPVLRRRDLLQLFDTMPDLSGDDVDVSRFIRDATDREVAVAWEDLPDEGPTRDHPLPGRETRCPVPIVDAKHLTERRSWRYDHIEEKWVRLQGRDLRPGMVVVVVADDGGYDAQTGWAATSHARVEPVEALDPVAAGLGADTGTGDDPVSFRRRRWLSLDRHLADVEAEVHALDEAIAPRGLSASHRRAAAVAGRLHDIGKAHPVFQDTLRRSAANEAEKAEAARHVQPWAKSAGSASARHSRAHFRHELASALALLGDGGAVLAGEPETDLIVYLVAAHHGRVRLGFRPLPGETPSADTPERPVALGVIDGDLMPEVMAAGTIVPSSDLDLAPMLMGSSADGRPSWAQRMLPLLDRPDLGPFRLAYLEAVVRMADWRASAAADDDDNELLP